ncbi:MAG: hypothetical protein H6606_06120 [Flavobacteriales bacterium]|nr:hypothetical protein [Flavobacteriales bacterium]
MARTIAQIEQEILTAKAADSNLNVLDSTSKTSIWRLWVYLCAFATWLHEKSDDLFRIEIQEIVSAKQAPTLPWYRNLAMNYLHGKSLTWNSDLQIFEQPLGIGEVAEDFMVVDYCSATLAPGKIKIKVAKEDSGSVPLSAPEEAGLTAYLNQVKAAGDTLELVNDSPDDLQIELDVYVDPLVINLSDGSLHRDASVLPAEIACQGYLQDLEFDGAFILNRFIDALQEAEGVVNPVLRSAKWRFGANPFTDIDVQVISNAGHFTFETLTINYLSA